MFLILSDILKAACGLAGCPLPILTLAMTAFPNQIKEKDEMHGNVGNFPLHEVCSWPCEQDSASTDPVISSRKGMAISALRQRYPNAAFVSNNNGKTPLDLALATGTTWDGGVRKLVRAYPASVSIQNSTTGLFPFMTAAAVSHSLDNSNVPLPSTKRSLMTHLKNMAKKDLQRVRTIYGLLRTDPDVIIADNDEDSSGNDSTSSADEDDDESSGNDSTSSGEESVGRQSNGWAKFGGLSMYNKNIV